MLTLIPLLLAAVPWDAVVPLAEHVVTGKATRDELIAAIPHILDDALDFDTLIPGELGEMLERLDGPAERAIVEWVADHAIGKAKRRLPAVAVGGTKAGATFFNWLRGRHLEPRT